MTNLIKNQNNELIPLTQRQSLTLVDSRIIADELGIQHKPFIANIRKHLISIESDFGKVHFEKAPSDTGSVQNQTIALLTEDQALFIGTLSRNNPRVVEFKAKLIKTFQSLRKPTDPMQILEVFFQQMKVQRKETQELRLEQEEIKKDLTYLEAKVTTKNEDYYTISGFSSLHGKKVPRNQAVRLGKAASKLSKAQGVKIGSEHDAKYGSINSYHKDILTIIFKNYEI